MREHIMGVTVSEMSMDTKMEVASTKANSWKRRPTMPPMNRMGTKTAMSERLMERTVKPISSAPLKAAAMGAMPASMKRVIFSMTTIASSTTKPVEMVRAMSERLSTL
jgi:hypothetical protein